jgi:cytochrome b subunit of formate dehydrogenase
MNMGAGAAAFPRSLLGVFFLLLIISVQAQDIDCAECHDDVVLASPAHPDVVCLDCHTNVTAEHNDDNPELAALTDEESCVECHGRIQREVGRSAHDGEAGCNDCHGAAHEITAVADLHSAVSAVRQIQNCGGCHDTEEMPLDLYVASEHGRAVLLSGLDMAPGCSDCHGGHRIYAVDNDRSPTSHENSPEMCGTCHALLLDDWQNMSAHGLAWQESEEGPVCTDCHATHDIVDPTTAASRLKSADNCGGCHEEYLTTFRDSFHGQANDLGMSTGATCADCHTPHKNLPADNPLSSVNAANLAETCGQCHDNVTANFVSFDPHNDPTDPDDNFAVYIVWFFMTALLIGVFAFFGVHDLLWLQRSLVGVLRGEFDEEKQSNGQFVKRFNLLNIRMHVVIITTFLLLALTGLPLKFHAAPWAQQLMNLLGGVDFARVIHRLAAIGTFGYMSYHLGNLFIRRVFKKERGLLWGPNSMVPQPQDLKDFFANLRYFLYFGERPAGDRWTYFEKFDYLAVFWGVMIIGLSGLMLWFPGLFTTYLPGWILNAAHVIHSDEALLATGFIFVFHFFHTHLRPESFPMDIVVFTGKMSLERFKSERAREYQRLIDNEELDNYLVAAPTARERKRAYVWGSIFLTIGVALAIGIIWALLSH